MGKKKEEPIRFVFQAKKTNEEYVDEEIIAARKKREAYFRRDALIEKKKRKAKEKKNKSKQKDKQLHARPTKDPAEPSQDTTPEVKRTQSANTELNPEVRGTQNAKPGPTLSNKPKGLSQKPPLEDILEEVHTPARSNKHVALSRPSTIASEQASIRTKLPELSERVISSAKSSTQTHDKAPSKPELPPPVKRKGRFGGLGRTFTFLFNKKKKETDEVIQDKTKVLPPIAKSTTPEEIKVDEKQGRDETVENSPRILTPPLPPPPKVTCEIGIQTYNPPELKKKSKKTKARESVPPDHADQEERSVPSTKSPSVDGSESSMSIKTFGDSPLPPIESTAQSSLSKSPESQQADESSTDSKIETSPEVAKKDELPETDKNNEDSSEEIISNFINDTNQLAPHSFYTKQKRYREVPSRSGNLSRQFKIENLKEILQENHDVKDLLNGQVLLPLGTRHTESCPPGYVAETLNQQAEREQLDGEEFHDFDNDDDFYADVKKKWKIWREMRKQKREKKETEGYYKLLNLIYRGYDSDEELEFKSKYDINVDVEFQELKNNNADDFSPDNDENKLVKLVNKLEKDNYELSRKIKRRENQFPFSDKRLGDIKDQVEHEQAEKLLKERSEQWGDPDVPIVTYKERKMLERQEKKVKYTDDLMNYVKEFGIAVDPNTSLPDIDSPHPSTPGLGQTADVESLTKKTKEYKLKKNAAQALFDAKNDLKEAEKIMWDDIKTDFTY